MSELSAVRAEELASLAVFAGVPPAQLTDLAAHLEPLNAPRGHGPGLPKLFEGAN